MRAIDDNLSGKYRLYADIDLSTYNGGIWKPIGNTIKRGRNYDIEAFSGELDGNGHVVKNMKIETKTEWPTDETAMLFSGTYREVGATVVENYYVKAGLFGEISGATINNLLIEHASIRLTYNRYEGTIGPHNHRIEATNIYAGFIAGGVKMPNDSSYSNITNVYVKDSFIQGEGKNLSERERNIYDFQTCVLGGVVGETIGNLNINNCVVTNNSSILSTANYNGHAEVSLGGLIGGLTQKSNNGYINVSILNSYINEKLRSFNSYKTSIGGLVGGRDDAKNAYNLVVANCVTILSNISKATNTEGHESEEVKYSSFQPLLGCASDASTGEVDISKCFYIYNENDGISNHSNYFQYGNTTGIYYSESIKELPYQYLLKNTEELLNILNG